jgi:hypothetical protein
MLIATISFLVLLTIVVFGLLVWVLKLDLRVHHLQNQLDDLELQWEQRDQPSAEQQEQYRRALQEGVEEKWAVEPYRDPADTSSPQYAPPVQPPGNGQRSS